MPVLIRPATAADLARINEIYNHYVGVSTCTYQEQPETIEGRRAWFGRHGPNHPVIVAEAEGEVVAWGALSPFHVRSAYRYTVENSVYVDHEWRRQGIGSRLLGELIGRARAIGHRSIVAIIDGAQEASVALHARHGFRPAGRLEEVGYKFERWLDVVYLQLKLG